MLLKKGNKISHVILHITFSYTVLCIYSMNFIRKCLLRVGVQCEKKFKTSSLSLYGTKDVKCQSLNKHNRINGIDTRQFTSGGSMCKAIGARLLLFPTQNINTTNLVTFCYL